MAVAQQELEMAAVLGNSERKAVEAIDEKLRTVGELMNWIHGDLTDRQRIVEGKRR